MIERRLVDTNLIVRYLTQDHEKHAKAAERLFDRCERGEVTLVVLPVVLAECVFVLESFYKQAREDISRALTALITSAGVEITPTALYVDALKRYERSKLHFVDCVLAAHSAAEGMAVATFDRAFRKFPDVRVETA